MPILAVIGGGLAALGGGSAIAGAAIAGTAIAGATSLINNNNTNNAIKDAGQRNADATQQAQAIQDAASQRAEGLITDQYGQNVQTQNNALQQQIALNDQTRAANQQLLADSQGRQNESFGQQSALNDQSRQLQTQAYETARQQQFDSTAEQRALADQSTLNLQQTAAQTAQAYSPYTTTGNSALGALAKNFGLSYVDGQGNTVQGTGQGDMSGFMASPDYEYRRSEALRQVNAGKSAIGGRESGAALKALQDRSSNLAAGEYGNWVSRLQNLAGVGLSATQSAQGAAQGYANSIANQQTNKANVIAQGANNQANLGSSYANNLSNLNTAQQGLIGNNANNLSSLQSSYTATLGGLNNNQSNLIGSNAANLGNLGTSYAATIGNLATNNANNQAGYALQGAQNQNAAFLAQNQNNANTAGNIAGLANGVISNVAGYSQYNPQRLDAFFGYN